MRIGSAAVLRSLVLLAVVAALLVGSAQAGPGPLALALQGYAIYVAALPVGVAIHELGHLAAVRASGLRVTAIRIASPPAMLSWQWGATRVSLGLLGAGRVAWAGRASSARRILIAAAGPLANLVVAAALLPWSAHSWRVASAAIGIAFSAASLVPYRSGTGAASDGLTICRLMPAWLLPSRRRVEADVRRLLDEPDWLSRPDAADRLLAGYLARVGDAEGSQYHLMELLYRAGRYRELLRIHADPAPLRASPSVELVAAIHLAEYHVLTLPGVPRSAGLRSIRRLTWALENHAEPKDYLRHTHALAVLRAGMPRLVEQPCRRVLAGDLRPCDRATVLATIALARHALGQAGGDVLAEAISLDPRADLVAEAARVHEVPLPEPSEKAGAGPAMP